MAYTKEALERLRTRPKLTDETLQEMVKGYRNGKTIRELAAVYDYSYTGMRTLLYNAGVVFRKPGGTKGIALPTEQVAKRRATHAKKAAEKAAKKAARKARYNW